MSKRIKGFLAGELVSQAEVEKLKLSIPVAAGVDIATLTAATPTPFYVYVRAGRVGLSQSTVNGLHRNWTAKPFERLLGALPLYGYRGHPDAEQFQKQRVWRDFVTVWVGGVLVDGVLYLKGYVPDAETEFKQLIQLTLAAGKPMQVSPFGYLDMQRNGDVMDVVDFVPISVDWGQPGDAGFPDADVVAVGGELTEQEESPMTEEKIKELQDKCSQLGGELKTAQDSLTAVTKERDDLKTKVTQIGGELKTHQDAAAETAKAAVKAHREGLLTKLPEKVRTIGGELLTGDTVAALDTSFAEVLKKVAPLAPGMTMIGGELKLREAAGADPDFARD